MSKKYPIKEIAKVSTCNYYSYTKLLSEKKILKNNKNALVIRTNFLEVLLKINLSLKNKIFNKTKKKIYLWEDTFFNPVSIKFLIGVISKLVKKNANGIFNVSSDKCISKYNFGLMVAKKYNLPDNCIIKSFKKDRTDLVARPNIMFLDNRKIKKFLKIKSILINKQI